MATQNKANAQVQSDEIEKKLTEANALYQNLAFEQAIEVYRDVLLLDNSREAKIKLANCYRLTQNFAKAEYWYKLLINEVADPIFKLQYAQVLQSNGKCDQAYSYFLAYAQFDVWGKELAKGCENNTIEYLNSKTDSYTVSPLSINSRGNDYGIVIARAGLVFASNRDKPMGKDGLPADKGKYLDLFSVDIRPDKSYSDPQKLRGAVNTPLNDGPATLTRDGKTICYTSNYSGRNSKSDGTVKLGLFFSTQVPQTDKWSAPTAFIYNNIDYSVVHPYFSPDGNNLYFSSDMPGGQGGFDLYVSTRIDTSWSRPINLGSAINTPGNETFPYIHADGSLYFSSDGFAGLGGKDIFSAKATGSGWQKPRNLGAPFNSNRDDFGLLANVDLSRGYFCSNRPGSFGGDDIYTFQTIQITPEHQAGTQINPEITSANNLPPTELTALLLNDPLKLEKIQFAAGDWKLIESTKTNLDKVYTFLQQYPTAGVSLEAHSEARGDDRINQTVTQNRANAARDYLLLKGIAPTRVMAIGFGERQLINRCANNVPCTETEHQENNRFEVRLTTQPGDNVLVAVLTPPPPPIAKPDTIIDSLGNITLVLPPTAIENKPAPPKLILNSAPIIEYDIFGNQLPVVQTKNINLPTPPTPVDTTATILPNIINNDTPLLDPQLPDYRFKLVIGPFKEMNNDIFYRFKELFPDIEQEYSVKGMQLTTQEISSLTDAEYKADLAKQNDAPKTKIIPYLDGQPVDISIKKLKKLGVK
ncbi:MAG: PD40 domain-containing protein [Sphingobacteriales bacterium]|nr:PD40 domain-containing protein [Sphingobacteriales bacterium]